MFSQRQEKRAMTDNHRVLDGHAIEKIRRCLVDILNPVRVVIFGSYAKGEATKDSDVDIMVVVQDDVKLDIDAKTKARIALRKALAGTGLAFDLVIDRQSDFHQWKSRFGSLEYSVEQQGLVLHGEQTQFSPRLA